MGGKSSKDKYAKSEPKGTVTSKDRAILDLKNSRDRLKRYQTKLKSDEERLQSQAVKYLKLGRKDRALMVLRFRKKKMKESDNVEAQLLKVLEMVGSINWQEEQGLLMESLKKGKDMLKSMHEQMSVSDVLDLMDDIREEQFVERDIGDILGRGVSLDTIDDEECMRDVEDMEREMGLKGEKEEEEEVVEVEVGLPDVPTAKPGDLVFPDAPMGEVGVQGEKEEERTERVPVSG